MIGLRGHTVLVDAASIDALVGALDGDYDPLGLKAREDFRDAERDDRHGVARRVASDAIAGRDQEARRALLAHPALRRIDPVTADVLATLGVDIAAALALSDAVGRQGRDLSFHPPGRPDVLVEASALGWSVEWERGVRWNSAGTLRMRAMPAAITAAMIGRHAEEIVDLPAFRKNALTVVRAGTAKGWTTATLAPTPIDDIGIGDFATTEAPSQEERP